MATLVDDPQYHLWGLGAEVGPKGREAVATFYTDMIATGGNHFEFEIQAHRRGPRHGGDRGCVSGVDAGCRGGRFRDYRGFAARR